MTSNLEDFLRELAELSVRYGYWIAGCGECGSPWIERTEKADIEVECLGPTDSRDGYMAFSSNPWIKDIVVRVSPDGPRKALLPIHVEGVCWRCGTRMCPLFWTTSQLSVYMPSDPTASIPYMRCENCGQPSVRLIRDFSLTP